MGYEIVREFSICSIFNMFSVMVEEGNIGQRGEDVPLIISYHNILTAPQKSIWGTKLECGQNGLDINFQLMRDLSEIFMVSEY